MELKAVPPSPLTNAGVIHDAQAHLLQNYKQAPVVLARGQGSLVWDVEGRQYIDFICGVAVCALGHCHPELVATLKSQADTLWHVSNAFFNKPSIDLATKLTAASGLDRAFFCNSGAEANEALLKLARKYQKESGHPERVEFITFENSFHGRTLATLTATGQPKYQKGFEPLPAGFTYARFGDLESVKAKISSATAAVLVEPVQGEGGVLPAPHGFLKALRELCDQNGILLLVDEIQTGMGRTGKLFAFQHEGILPDAISLAKALGNGFPVGAILAKEKVAKALTPGSHGTTYGGNPLATAVAGKVFDLVSDPKMLEQIRVRGEYFSAGLQKLKAKYPTQIVAVRGQGLLWGVEVATEAGPYLTKCREAGLLGNAAGDKTVRFAPPFIVSEAELDQALGILDQVFAKMAG